MTARDVVVERAIARMRDGVALVADVYRPDQPGRFPVLLQRTPYGRGQLPLTTLTLDPLRAARDGFVVVIQDVRGRGESEGGPFFPYRHEFADGHDSVQWCAGLPWGDGRVGAYGVSYMGAAAWHAAAMAPPALRAIATAMSPCDFHDGHLWRGGAFLLGTFVMWSLAAIGLGALLHDHCADPRLPQRFADLADAIDAFEDAVRHRPAAELPAARFLPFFAEVVGRERPDELTRSLSMTGRHGDVRAPALIVAGWHDFLLESDLAHHRAMRERDGGPDVRLVVGPWSHGWFLPAVGERDFGLRASGLFIDLRQDLTGMQLDWFRSRLAHDDDDGAPVRVFVQGPDRWRSLDDWPPPSRLHEWFLAPGGGLADGPVSGMHPPDEYIYEPEDPCPTRGGAVFLPRTYAAGPVEQAPVMARPDVLTYTSAPLERPLAVAGSPSVELYCATSAVATDWVVKLCETGTDGRTLNVCDGILRMAAAPEVFEARPIALSSTAHVFRAGSRLRMIVTSSDFPRYDTNPNTGVAGTLATRSQPARQRIGRDATRPSRLLLPVVDWA